MSELIDDTPIDAMSKDDLAMIALGHGVELDMSKRIDVLRKQVQGLVSGKAVAIIEEAKAVKAKTARNASHLQNPVTGTVFPWTALLHARGDLIACDMDGNPV